MHQVICQEVNETLGPILVGFSFFRWRRLGLCLLVKNAIRFSKSKKGLRGRIIQVVTLSQNGYGDNQQPSLGPVKPALVGFVIVFRLVRARRGCLTLG